jgi:ATP-dependent Clp protease ATP-binding subunit ClpC
MFNALSDEGLRKILDLLLKKEVKLAGERGLALEVTEPTKTWLLVQNDHPEWGARPLRRIIQKFVREPLADYLLEKNPATGMKIKVDVEGEKLKMIEG